MTYTTRCRETEHPCTYVWPRGFENTVDTLLEKIFRGDVSDLDQLIDEAKANNYGDCRERSSLATSLRFLKGFGLYLAKDYSRSAQEFETALAEITPENTIDREFSILTLAMYPAALIKSDNIPKAKEVLETRLYMPLDTITGDDAALLSPFLQYYGKILPIPTPQKYSLPTLALSLFIKEVINQNSPHPSAIAMHDTLKTLAPYTPIPDFILKHDPTPNPTFPSKIGKTS